MMINFLAIILVMTSMIPVYSTDSCNNKNVSHEKRDSSLQAVIHKIVDKVKKRQNLEYVSVERQLELIELLADFGLGRFLLERGGLNGYWTHYAIKHPFKGRLTGLNDENKPLNALEDYLLNQAPTALATQQRFEIFKVEIQKRLHEGGVFASIPCGLMADLLDLDFTNVSNVSLIGIDLDLESIAYAKQYAKSMHLDQNCTFFQRDAWALDLEQELDLITSNGLNIYEPDDAKVIELYQRFFKAVKPGGYLVTSFLTPPPASGLKTEWKLDAVNREDALLQKVIFADILEGKWQAFRAEAVVKSQLETAGFNEIEIIYDTAHIFPTVIARRPLKF